MTEYYQNMPEDLTDEEKASRDVYILEYLKKCFEVSPEGRALLDDANASADKWLLGQRAFGAPSPEAAATGAAMLATDA